MKVLPLKGYKSYQALGAFHKLMLGVKMLPAYITDTYEDFYSRVSGMDPADQEKVIREAAVFVDLNKEEVEVLLGFCTDANGVPVSAENMKEIGPKEIFEMVVAVSKEISKIKIDFVTESEKKNSVGSQ